MNVKFKKQLLVSSGIILVSFVGAFVAIYFLSNNLSANAAKVIRDRDFLFGQTNTLSNLASLKQDAPLAAQYLVAINKLLPPQDQLINFSQYLNTMARNDGVAVTFSFQGEPIPRVGDRVGTAAFSVNVTGVSGNVANFLQDLESKSQGYLLSLSSFDYASEGTAVNFTAQGTLFFQ